MKHIILLTFQKSGWQRRDDSSTSPLCCDCVVAMRWMKKAVSLRFLFRALLVGWCRMRQPFQGSFQWQQRTRDRTLLFSSWISLALVHQTRIAFINRHVLAYEMISDAPETQVFQFPITNFQCSCPEENSLIQSYAILRDRRSLLDTHCLISIALSRHPPEKAL